MKNVSSGVLAEKIENIHEKLDDIKEILKEEIKPAIKKNTAFRHKAKAVAATITIMAGVVGGIISWIIYELTGR